MKSSPKQITDMPQIIQLVRDGSRTKSGIFVSKICPMKQQRLPWILNGEFPSQVYAWQAA